MGEGGKGLIRGGEKRYRYGFNRKGGQVLIQSVNQAEGEMVDRLGWKITGITGKRGLQLRKSG